MSVATLRARLTQDDIKRLAGAGSAEDRALAAAKVCRKIDVAGLTDAERLAAGEVLRVLANDAAELVRRALALTLKNSPHLPRDVARRLAEDVDSIATPILEASPVLTDNDLIALVRTGEVSRQIAIAGRSALSGDVVDVLVETGAEPAVARAASNDNATFSETAMVRALSRFSASSAVADAFVERSWLPTNITEKLVSRVTDVALQRLVRRHALPPQLAVELAEGARERATIDLIDQAGCAVDVRRFVQQLQLNGRLTPSLILRGACCGCIGFLEHALAELAGVAHDRAWLLVHDAGPLGLRALYDRTGLPARLFPGVRAAVDVYHELQSEGGALARERFTQAMIERVLTRHQGMARDDIDYLLEKLDALSADLAPQDLGGAPQREAPATARTALREAVA